MVTASPAPRIPPGPKGNWLTGVMPEFTRDSLAFVTRLSRDYGDVVRTRFLYLYAYFLYDPRDIERVLVTDNKNFIKPRSMRTPFFARIVGHGLLTSEGDFWLRQRRLVQPAFHRERLDAYGASMVEHAERMTARWREGQTLDLHEEMMRLTMEIVARVLFSADVAGDTERVKRALAEIAEPFSQQATLKWIADNRLPTRVHRRFFRTVGELDEVIYKIIRERREAGARDGHDDLLSTLLAAQDEDGSRMNDRQLRDEVMTLFLAGQETTALALSWTWHLLMQHPEVERKLHAELDEVLGLEDGGTRVPTFADLPRLRYAEMVIKESMRLYPPAWGVGREAVKECEIGGYRVRKGAQIFMMTWAVHRDPRLFDAPEEFRPERWAGEEIKQLPKYAYFPFGGGPRLCVGNTFAMTEAVLCLASIARRFRFTPAPGHSVSPMPAMSLRPRDGIKAVAHARETVRQAAS